MIEKLSQKNDKIKSFDEIPAEYLRQSTSDYIDKIIAFFEERNFLDLSKENCKSICSLFRYGLRNKELEEYLNKMGVRVYICSFDSSSRSYILEFEDSVYLESSGQIFLKDEFSSNNGKRYLRPFTVNGKEEVILQVEKGCYYFLEYYLHTILEGGITLEYGVLKNSTGLGDIIDFKRKRIHEIGGMNPVSINNIIRLTVSQDPKVYVEFNGENVSPPIEVKDEYPLFGSDNQEFKTPPTYH